jgi:chaperonin GroEL
MQPKNVHSEVETRAKLLSGARKVYEAVKSTYSPQSGNVAIELNYGNPVVSHDGVTVARSIALSDPVENMGARFLKEASEQTNRVAGDGTSATVILGYHLIEDGNKLLAAGYNPMAIRRGIEKAAIDIKKEIKDHAQSISEQDLVKVAAISAGDDALGALIADTLVKVGKTGGVNVEQYSGLNVEQDIVEGFFWSEGLESPYMINNVDLRRAEYDEVFVLVADKKLRDVTDVQRVLEIVFEQKSKNLLIVGDVSGFALNTLVQNKLEGKVNSMSVKTPPIGAQRTEFLQDIAAQTGAQVITEGQDMAEIDYEQLGYADRVLSSQTYTTIYGGAGDQKDVAKRIKLIQKQLDEATDAGLAEKLEDRLAKLTGKIGVIKVGGATETERKEKMLRVEDAVYATKAARAEGVVPGGASTLLHIGGNKTLHKAEQTDEHVGYSMVYKALAQPFKQLMKNAGLDDVGYHVYAALKEGFGYGFNVKKMTDEPIDLEAAGILDPAKVLTQVVENACSTAGLVITTNAAVTFDKEEMRKDAVFQGE